MKVRSGNQVLPLQQDAGQREDFGFEKEGMFGTTAVNVLPFHRHFGQLLTEVGGQREEVAFIARFAMRI